VRGRRRGSYERPGSRRARRRRRRRERDEGEDTGVAAASPPVVDMTVDGTREIVAQAVGTAAAQPQRAEKVANTRRAYKIGEGQ
jgi:hypothetical protein